LLGPNGAGKSSLMRTIATLQQQDSGSIIFNGINTLKEPHKIRQILGYLPQDFDVYPRISAYDLLEHLAILKGLNNKKTRRESVEGLLAQTNLWEVREKAVSTFLGGMRQRFGIAQALLGDPDLIIVDEPTAGLDPEERNRFHNLLSDIGENKVVILSTHIFVDIRKPLTIKSKKTEVDGKHEKPAVFKRIKTDLQVSSDWSHFKTRTKFEVFQIVKSAPFLVLCLISFFSLSIIFIDTDGLFGTANWPLSRNMADYIMGAFSLMTLVVITYYSAEIVWRERQLGIGDIVESTPIKNWAIYFPKLIAFNFCNS